MKNRFAIGAAAAIAMFAAGWPLAAAAAAMPDPGSAASAASSSLTVAAAPLTQINPRGAWPVYHRDDAHTGSDPGLPGVCCVKAGWASATLDGQMYASPLVYGGIVYAATLNNTVYALNQIDGSLIWSNHLRNPQTGGWTCGGFQQGILGTGVVDPLTGRIYVVTLDIADDHYRLEGLNLATGVEEIDTDISAYIASIGVAFDWKIQQERAAIAIANGNVYVPFGGRAGDCGPYHGWVFAVPTNGAPITHYYVTPGVGSSFWGAGGAVVDDSTGKVFVTSGNGTGSGCAANGDGTPAFENDAVVRLSATLAHEDSFVPFDWHANWCINDMDLGSAGPLLISPNLMFQSGKWGTGFLLNPNALGGMGHQLFPAPLPAAYSEVNTCVGNHSDANFGSYAYAAPFIYLECQGDGIIGLHVNLAAPSFAPCDNPCVAPDWQAGAGLTFGPPIVAGGLVWAASSGNGLYAFDATTGAQMFHSAAFSINHFVTLAEAGGQVFVPSMNVIRSFVMGFRVGQSTAAPAPPAPRPPVVQVSAPALPPRPAVNQSSPAPAPYGR